jgi:LysM repeat protein
MIESVYSNDNTEINGTGRVQANFKMPKNIRQIGKSNVSKKIYVEDYVMTFTKQLAGEDYSSCRVAVLLGHYVSLEQGRCIFISGAVEVEDIDIKDEIVFTNDHWTSIYENIKKYFVESEIVGWFLGGPGYILEDKERILKAHIDNFAGQDKTLLTYDNMEKEEAFYFYENGALCRQEGYYIYYEKNEKMQDYMIEHKQKPSEEAQYDDRVSREIRTIFENKKPQTDDENKSINRLMYAAGTLLAVIILVVGAAILSNYDQMKNMQDTLNSLSQNLKEVESVFLKNEDAQVSQDIVSQDIIEAKNEQPTSIPSDTEESLDIEVISGEVTPLPEKSEKEEIKEEEKEDKNQDKKDKKDSEDGSSSDKNDKKQAEAEKEQSQVEHQINQVEATGGQDLVSSEGEVKYYTVKAGDSLAGISYKLYNSANYISKIKELNNIEDEDMIYIGQKLIVP